MRARSGSRGDAFVLRNYPIVMCAIDLNRAQGMLANINEIDPKMASFIRQRIMQYILMSRPERVSGSYF